MDVVALGELLIDFTDYGVSGQGNPVYEANPGGAPCNVLAMLSKLGSRGYVRMACGLTLKYRRRLPLCTTSRMGIEIFLFTVIPVRT